MRAMLRRCTSLLLPLYCAVVAVIAANEAVVLATPSTSAAAASAKASSGKSSSSEKESGADATLRMLVTTATIAFAVLHGLAACALLWLHTRKAHTTHATLRNIVYAVLLSCALMHILCVVGFGAVHHLEQRMPLLSARLDRVLLPSQQGSCRAAPQHTAATHTTLASLSTHDNGSSSSSKDAQQQEEDSMMAAAGSDGVLAAAQYMSSTTPPPSSSPSHTSSLTVLDYYDALHVALKTAWQVLLVLFDALPPSSSAAATGGDDVVHDAMGPSRLLRRPLWLLSMCGVVLVVTAAAMATNDEEDEDTIGESSARVRARNSTVAVRASATTATNATMADTEAEGQRTSALPSPRTTQTLATDGQRNGKKVQ